MVLIEVVESVLECVRYVGGTLGTSEVGGRPRRSQRPVGALLEAAGCSMCDVAKNLVVKIGG